MSLQPLLSLIGILGRRRMVVDNDSDRRNSQRTVFAAASVLADWPNFFRLLRGITEGMRRTPREVSREGGLVHSASPPAGTMLRDSHLRDAFRTQFGPSYNQLPRCEQMPKQTTGPRAIAGHR